MALDLQALGLEAYALEGGLTAWRAAHPIEVDVAEPSRLARTSTKE